MKRENDKWRPVYRNGSRHASAAKAGAAIAAVVLAFAGGVFSQGVSTGRIESKLDDLEGELRRTVRRFDDFLEHDQEFHVEINSLHSSLVTRMEMVADRVDEHERSAERHEDGEAKLERISRQLEPLLQRLGRLEERLSDGR